MSIYSELSQKLGTENTHFKFKICHLEYRTTYDVTSTAYK